MVSEHIHNYLEFLDSNDNSALLIAPVYIDFINAINNLEFYKSLNALNEAFTTSRVKHIVSSSAGTILLLLLSLGYSVKEIKAKFKTNNCYNQSPTNNALPLSVITEINNDNPAFDPQQRRYSILEEDNFLLWIQEQIASKLGNPLATFTDLYKCFPKNEIPKNIHFIVFNLALKQLEIFNYKKTPQLPLAIAARICLSYSTTYPAVKIQHPLLKKDYFYLDGGIILKQLNIWRTH